MRRASASMMREPISRASSAPSRRSRPSSARSTRRSPCSRGGPGHPGKAVGRGLGQSVPAGARPAR
eukprot:9462047-Lingulodinium_polyedra.AAC.1